MAAGLQQLLVEFGRLLAQMHDGGVVHGDLSSSCALVTHTNQALVSTQQQQQQS
jgi:tRNA A-37 threonylcarbamoyl transferase component Bud32